MSGGLDRAVWYVTLEGQNYNAAERGFQKRYDTIQLLRKIYVQAGLRGPVYLLLPKFAWSCTILCFFLLRSRPNTHRRTKLNITRNWVSASCYIERCRLFLGIGVINWGEWNRFVIRFRPSPFKYFAIHNKTNKRRKTINKKIKN